MTAAEDALDRLPSDARARLEAFAGALERIPVADLVLYMTRPREPAHRRAVERAAVTAREAGMDEPIDAAREALAEGIIREFASGQFRVWVGGVGTAPNLGPGDERVRILRSLGDAVSALVLWDALDESDRAELLGLWSRLLP
jgi:hypothetical protein